MYRIALFDFDGTLVDSSECAVVATLEVFKRFDLPPQERSSIVQLMGVPIERSFEMLAGAAYPKAREKELFQEFRNIYRDAAESLVSAFPGILEMLTTLKQNQIPVAILSSKKSDVITTNLRNTGLAPFVGLTIGSDKVKNYKPHPESVFRALADLGVDTIGQALVVGDSTFDIDMAHRAGLAACGVTWGAHSGDQLRLLNPAHVVDTVSALGALFEVTKSV